VASKTAVEIDEEDDGEPSRTMAVVGEAIGGRQMTTGGEEQDGK
jgi:hypothetical protein